MTDVGVLLLLYGVGLGMLVAEIFIPSHGVLTVVGLAFLIAAVVRTFSVGGQTAGVIAILACAVVLPTFAYLSVKFWPHTPIGKRIAPPNPVLTSADTTVPVEELHALVGQTGRTLSPLRPVGICEFNGRRISCVAQMSAIDADTSVEGIGVRSGHLAVRVKAV